MNPFDRGAADFARLLESSTTAGGAPGLALVAQLRTAGAALDTAVAPRPEFRDALRKRLMAVATVQAAQAAAPAAAPRALSPALSWRRRGSAVAAGAMASVVAVSGVAVAGGQSLPGDPFYGVKRTTEALQLRMADGDVDKGTRHLDFAATRLREVRGLTLGRDASDAGPVLGPAALSGGLASVGAGQPLAAGAALSAGVAERVRDTLAEMDAQTRAGSELLTEAYRASKAREPLRALDRFATRQAAGLEQLLPTLPPATQTRALASLALLSDVSDSTEELMRIGTCGDACDPTSAAPVLPAVPGQPAAPDTAADDCECPEPAPVPQGTSSPSPTPAPASAKPEPTRSPTPSPTSPAPSSSPTRNPLPVPLPVPIPSLPLPTPSISLPPIEPLEPIASVLDPLLPGISGNAASGSSPVPPPAPSPTPPPQLAPLPPRD